jgi:hypothetical protein
VGKVQCRTQGTEIYSRFHHVISKELIATQKILDRRKTMDPEKYQRRRFQECERKLVEHINAPHLFCKPFTFFFVNPPMNNLKGFE